MEVIKAVARTTLGVLIGIGMAGLAGCGTQHRPARVVTVTVPAPSPTTTAPSSRPAPATTRSVASATALPGNCASLLPLVDVAHAMRNVTLAGRTDFVIGTPDKTIGRLAYLNCRYGISGTGSAADPKVEIGVSLYQGPGQADGRVQATVADYRAHGATATRTLVDGRSGQLLMGGRQPDYHDALMVIADGQRTIAVSVDPALAAAPAIAQDGAAVAALALARTDQ